MALISCDYNEQKVAILTVLSQTEERSHWMHFRHGRYISKW